MELIIVHSMKPPPSGFQTRSLLFQLWYELCNFLVVENTFPLNLPSFYLRSIKVDPHLIICPTKQKFITFILKKFLTGILFWLLCQQLACDTSTWLNSLAFAVGISSSSTILVLCLYPCIIQTYCSRGITSHPTPIKPQLSINPCTKQICFVKLF